MSQVPAENKAHAILPTNKKLRNSHQNSHSSKVKMAADSAASHITDFIWSLAPQVGLEPTTLRLTAECSAIELLRSVTLRSSFINLAERFKSVKNCFSRRNPCPPYAYPLLFANNCRQFPIGGNCRLRRSWDAFRPGMKGGTFISNLSTFAPPQIIDVFGLLKLRPPCG